MNLYLIRHGESEQGPKPDQERSLTADGAGTVKKIARRITEIVPPPAVILSSPLRRAIETAEFFANGWKLKTRQVDWLRSDVEPSIVIEELKKIREESIALVGHLPNLGLLTGVLLWGLPPKEIVLPKACVAHLALSAPEPASARLKWLVTPEII